MKGDLTNKELMKNLLENYEKQMNKYKKVLNLSKQQQKAIKDNNWDKLNELINDKKGLINAINKLENEIHPYKINLINQVELKTEQNLIKELIQQNYLFTEKLKIIIKKTYQIMHQIRDLDIKSQEELNNNKQEVQKTLRNIKRGLNVNNSYSSQLSNYEGKFIDKKE